MFILTKKKTYPVKRYSGGSYVNKEWVPNTPEDLTIEANIQPANFNDLRIVPEGDRTTRHIKIYTQDFIQEPVEGEDTGDLIYFQNSWYRVCKLKQYDMGVLNHYHALAMEVVRAPTDLQGAIS